MKKMLLFVFALVFFFYSASFISSVFAQPVDSDPIICGCPSDTNRMYQERQTGETCVTDYATFKQDPVASHLWIEDPEITAQGKADDRARQFIYWVVTHSSIDNHPVLFKVWSTARNVSYFFVILIAAIMGVGIIITQRTNFNTNIKVWPSIMKIILILLYISFSASLIITMIQLSEIMMKFFIENLGGKDLFNIYFGGISQEKNYLDFVGCRDLNIRVQEAYKAEMFMLKLTNISYYVMGGMLILRKVLLWFLLFVSPFLALFMPFVFIRNIGWIWIGVFFQWVFYGPLFALFLGALASIWKAGIPFIFDFSRVGTTQGYIFPTAINILYGGPAQRLAILNNGNYVDTFAEYIITLIMLWAVTFFPWWLLRIFRDYCCEGIIAMKNIIMSMYDQQRGTPPTPPGPAPIPTTIGTALKIPREVEIPIKVKLETVEEIKHAKTEEITRSLNMTASHLADIAHFETNKQTNETVRKNLNFLQNPTQAQTMTDRQHYMNIRTELYNRSLKSDQIAQHILSSISTSRVEQMQRRQDILKTIPQMVPVTHIVSVKVKLSQEAIKSVTASLSENNDVVNSLAEKTKLQAAQVKTVLSALHENIDQAPTEVAQKVAEKSGVKKEQVAEVLDNLPLMVKENKEVTQAVADIVSQPEKNIEQTVSIPPSISLEDYEQVKKMWKQQYEKGEVPVAENIQTREQWVAVDIVFITNTLNKLLSSNEELRQEGLDDIGYILPIFLINNLKGEELIVYLKAKLEAAKSVQEEKQKEKEIEERLKSKTEEEFVEVAKPKQKEAEKELKMEEKMEIKDEKKTKEKPVT
ncbi:hypothetical protein HY041_00685 [Candidatus Roizmanbacteria bacterium]|nr:hypothetical protein [Candidatus Roizmanbacteria bacterium]